MTKPSLHLLKGEHSKSEERQDDAEKEEPKVVGILELFSYSSRLDKLFMFLGTLTAMVSGMSYPVMTLIFGGLAESFVNSGSLTILLDRIPDFLKSQNLTYTEVLRNPSILEPLCPSIDSFYKTNGSCSNVELDEPLTDAIEDDILYFIIVGLAVQLSATGQVALWTIAAERQVNRIRRLFLANVLRQNIGWFDTHDVTEINTRLTGDMVKIQNGIGDKVATVIQYLSCFVAGFVIAFVKKPKYAAVVSSISPLLFVAAGMFSYFASSFTAKEQKAYAKAGAIAEEVLSAIRTVVAFGGEEKEVARYDDHLGEAQRYGITKGLTQGISIGAIGFTTFTTFALGLWYGGKLIRDEDYAVNDVLTVFFCITVAVYGLGVAAPGFQSLTEARGSAYGVFQFINLKSQIDSSSEDGLKLNNIKGTIQFRGVHFNYPARPDLKVLNGVNIDIRPGQTVALVGSSGCGKSTSVQLLLRFYDPDQGEVLLDGINVKRLNVKWLRQSIGLVSQEPVLFDTTIGENIRYGQEDATMEEIIQAAKDANAYDFIAMLPDKFDTLVGEGGAQLSGGQKQRIAIARALVRDPKILLLDEATSALDTESESVVQDALDKARQGRTTLVIAHRLSTVRTADIIIGLDNGMVKERGTHKELMAHKGIYWALVTNQASTEDNEDASDNVKRAAPTNSASDFVHSMTHSHTKRLLSVNSGTSDGEDEMDEELPDTSFLDLLRMNSPEGFYLFLGIVGALINGGCQPAFAYAYSKILTTFSEDLDDQKDDIAKYTLMLVGTGVVMLGSATLQNWMFAISGEGLTKRLRKYSFGAMLRQEMGWFDKPINSTGSLTSRLSNDATLLQGAAGTRLGAIMQCLTAIGGSLVLAIIFGWQLSLVCLGFFPFMLLSGLIQHKLMGDSINSNKEALEQSGKIVVEALGNIRTVASLTRESTFQELYARKLAGIRKRAYKMALVVGLVFAFSFAVVFYTMSAIFAYGSHLIEDNEMDSGDVFAVFALITFSGFFLGSFASFGPEIGKAKMASQRIFYILQRKSEIDATSSLGLKPELTTMKSSICMEKMKFRYPNRPDVQVLKGMTLRVEPGQTVALVGGSGCGKSTCVALLERFYDIDSGQLMIDRYDIKDLNIRWLRSQVGLVSQEPVLFDCSIAENIAYGDNSRNVSMDEIINAARRANIHNFIQGLPRGYDTNVGERGTQLSGGQKQRVAIARAMVRNPKILLLDEATSALDTESEKIVQEALDKAKEGRTCITIAHRLSTIQDADKIVVIKQGQVTEAGTHEELLALKGHYYRLRNTDGKA